MYSFLLRFSLNIHSIQYNRNLETLIESLPQAHSTAIEYIRGKTIYVIIDWSTRLLNETLWSIPRNKIFLNITMFKQYLYLFCIFFFTLINSYYTQLCVKRLAFPNTALQHKLYDRAQSKPVWQVCFHLALVKNINFL